MQSMPVWTQWSSNLALLPPRIPNGAMRSRQVTAPVSGLLFLLLVVFLCGALFAPAWPARLPPPTNLPARTRGHIPYPVLLAVLTHDSMYGLCNASGCTVGQPDHFSGRAHHDALKLPGGFLQAAYAVQALYGAANMSAGPGGLDVEGYYGPRGAVADRHPGCRTSLLRRWFNPKCVCLPSAFAAPKSQGLRFPLSITILKNFGATGPMHPDVGQEVLRGAQRLDAFTCHHNGHAALAFHDSPFRRAVAFVVDGRSANGKCSAWRMENATHAGGLSMNSLSPPLLPP